MNTDEFADLLDGIRTGLGGTLRKDAASDLTDAANLFRQFPGQSISTLGDAIDDALSGQRTTVPAMLERLRAVSSTPLDPADLKVLESDIDKTKAEPIKKILRGLGLKPQRYVKDNRDWLKAIARGASDQPVADSVDQAAVAELVARYRDLGKRIGEVSFAELQAEADRFETYGAATLRRVLDELGQDTRGSAKTLARRIHGLLERWKADHDHAMRARKHA